MRFFFFQLAFLAFLAAGAFFYLTGTTHGSVWLARQILEQRLDAEKVSYRAVSGNLVAGLNFQDVAVLNAGKIPGKGLAEAETLRFRITAGAGFYVLEAGNIRLHPKEHFESGRVQFYRQTGSGRFIRNAVLNGVRRLPVENRILVRRLFFSPASLRMRRKILADGIRVWTGQEGVRIEKADGTTDNIFLHDVEIRNIRGFDAGDRILIQKLGAAKPFGWNGVHTLENGRLRLGLLDTVVFSGRQRDSRIEIQIFSPRLDIDRVPFESFGLHSLKSLRGAVSEADVVLSGQWPEMQAKGALQIEALSYHRFRLENARVVFDLRLKRAKNVEMEGAVRLEGGEIHHKEISLYLNPGKIEYRGDPGLPYFDLSAQTEIEDWKISVVLKGSLVKPDLYLTSDPPAAEEKLLIMLATGREWTGSEKALAEGRISVDAAKEFVDYFFLGGSADKLSRRLGIKAISLQIHEDVRGVEVKKEISRKVDVAYGVETVAGRSERGVSAQKVGLDYKVSRGTTVSVEGRTESGRQEDELSEQSEAVNNSVMMKLKNDF